MFLSYRVKGDQALLQTCGGLYQFLYLSLGFSASRSQSPSRLIDSTITTSATPGKMVIHHSPENKNSLPIRINVPSDGSVGGTPTPRNESVASVRIAVAMLIVASTSTGPSTLGRRC